MATNPTGTNGVLSTLTSRDFLMATDVYENLIKEQVDTSLFNPYGNNSVNSFFRENAMEEMVTDAEWFHFEEGRANELLVGSCSASASAGDAVTFAVNAASQFTYGEQYPYATTNDRTVFIPRVGTILKFPNGILGRVDSISGANLTVEPLLSTESIPATTTSDAVVVGPVTMGEGTGTPDPSAFRYSQFRNSLWIAKDSFEITDLAENVITVIEDEAGSKWSLTMEQWNKILTKFNNELDMLMLTGKKITNGDITDTSVPSGDGYLPYIENFGYNTSYVKAVGMTMADIDKIGANIAEMGGSSEYSVMGGFTPRTMMFDLLKDEAGDASFKTFIKGQEQAVNLDFTALTRSGITYHIKHADIFTNPSLLGAAGHDTKDMLVFMPTTGTTQTAEGRRGFLKVKCLNKAGVGYNAGYFERLRSGTMSNELDEHKSKYDISARKGIDAYGQENHILVKAV